MKHKAKRKTAPKKKDLHARRTDGRPAKRSRARRMPLQKRRGDLIDALVAAHAQALGMSIHPAWQNGVKFNLGLILRLGALVDDFPLADESEPGPVFHA
jgi:hypothetical protein